MEKLFFLVTGSDAWTDTFHKNYFVENGDCLLGKIGAFTDLFVISVLIGIVVSVAYYFLFCNSTKSNKGASIGNWCIAMVVAALLAFAYSDQITIGHRNSDNQTGFYQANEDYFTNSVFTADQDRDNTYSHKQTIAEDLDNYKDVRLPLDGTAAVYSVVFFCITSMVVKRFTINGKTIPFARP